MNAERRSRSWKSLRGATPAKVYGGLRLQEFTASRQDTGDMSRMFYREIRHRGHRF